MVKKAIIFQVLVIGVLSLLLYNPNFPDERLKKAQQELNLWELVRHETVDKRYYDNLDISKGRFIIIGFGSYSFETSSLFNAISQNSQIIHYYKVIALSPFARTTLDNKRDSTFGKYITFKYGEMNIDGIIRGIPFTTIAERKEQIEMVKNGGNGITAEYPVVIVLNNNRIVWAKKRVSDFSEIKLN